MLNTIHSPRPSSQLYNDHFFRSPCVLVVIYLTGRSLHFCLQNCVSNSAVSNTQTFKGTTPSRFYNTDFHYQSGSPKNWSDVSAVVECISVEVLVRLQGLLSMKLGMSGTTSSSMCQELGNMWWTWGQTNLLLPRFQYMGSRLKQWSNINICLYTVAINCTLLGTLRPLIEKESPVSPILPEMVQVIYKLPVFSSAILVSVELWGSGLWGTVQTR